MGSITPALMVVKKMVIKFKETIEISEDEAGAISKVYCLMKKIVDESRDKDTQDTARDIIDGLDEIIDKTVTVTPPSFLY